MVHHVANLANHVAGNPHHARFLAVNQRHSQLRRRAKLRAASRQPGRPVEICQWLADRRREVATVEVPLSSDPALDAVVHIDRELPAIRVLQARGVLELNPHQVVGDRPGGRRIIAKRQLGSLSYHRLRSHLHIVEEQLDRGVIDGVRTIGQQDADRLDRRDTRNARQRAYFRHIRPVRACATGHPIVGGNGAAKIPRVIDEGQLARFPDEKKVQIKTPTRLPIHHTEWVQSLHGRDDREEIRIELIRHERREEVSFIRADWRREKAAGVDSAEHDVTIIVVHIRPVSGNRHPESVGARAQFQKGHRLHHEV